MPDPTTSTDEQLMRELAHGQDQALDDLVNRWKEKLISFLLRMTYDRPIAMDLAQETFVRVYKHRKNFRSDARFSTWLFTIATNLARNQARWKQRHPEASLEDTENYQDRIADSSPSPADAAESRETIQAIKAAVGALPPYWREALILSTYHGLSHTQIAEISGCSAKAVEVRIYRARQSLKETLAPLHRAS
jgi:RNA polymerase sigma-70 factor (ECF subfamily)